MTIYKLRDIKDNPFRDRARYALRPAKIAALRANYQATNFWDNVVGRAVEDGAELAYGHHRIAAAIDEYGEDYEIDLIVRELDDVTMLKMMALENMEEYATDFSVAMETVRAVVLAYGAGKIDLPRIPARTSANHRRYAPLFQLNQRPSPDAHCDRSEHPNASQAIVLYPYTIGTIGEFLGWPGDTIEYAVRALQLIELDMVTEDHFTGLNLNQVKPVVIEVSRAYRRLVEEAEAAEAAAQHAAATAASQPERAEASEQLNEAAEGFRDEAIRTGQHVADRLTEGLREGTITAAGAAEAARQITDPPEAAPAPDLNQWSRQLAKRVMTVKKDMEDRFEKLLPYQEYLSEAHCENLVFALDKLIVQATDYKAKLQQENSEIAPISATGSVRRISHGT